MKLSRDQKERYARQTILDQVGEEGQLKLLAARVLIVGLGGLGAPVASYLVAAGVGTIGLVDGDVVDASNLQRQVIFSESQVGQAKVQAARVRLLALNKSAKINMHKVFIDGKNAEAIVADYDLVIDCSDNFAARYAINDACLAQGKAFVFGSLYRFEGQVSLFCAGPDRPCYRCFYPQLGDDCSTGDIPNCAEAGIIGSLAGVIGSLQATEALKYLLGAGDSLAGRVLMYDGLSMRFSSLNLSPAENCRCRGESGEIFSSESLLERASEMPAVAKGAAAGGASAVISPDELAKILDEDDQAISLVDVRELKEHRAMRLRNSQLIPLNELIDRAEEIDLERPVVVYCRTGTRSRKACAMLRDCGFEDVRNLTGGIMAWYREFEERDIETDASIESI